MTAPKIYKFDHFAEPVTRQQIHDMAVDHAEAQFKKEGHADFMTLIANGGHVAWVQTLWEDDREKVASVHFLRRMMQEVGATVYASIQEAWSARVMDDMNEADKNLVEGARKVGGLHTLPPRLRDDVLIIFSFDREDNVGMSRYLVTVREPRGRNFLGPRIDDFEGGRFAGRMGNMLLPERTEADIRRDANASKTA